MGEFGDKIIFYILLLIGITMHEFGHAFAADRLGDPLPRAQGRVSMNPLAHIDMLGTVILPLLMLFSGPGLLFGWGKPVQVSLPNPKTRMRDDLLSTAAGPAMNFVLAFISAVLIVIGDYRESAGMVQVGTISLLINCMLMVFNMIPVPPLDGSHFLRYALNMSSYAYARVSQYGFFILLAIIMIPQTRALLHGAIMFVADALLGTAYFIGRLLT